MRSAVLLSVCLIALAAGAAPVRAQNAVSAAVERATFQRDSSLAPVPSMLRMVLLNDAAVEKKQPVPTFTLMEKDRSRTWLYVAGGVLTAGGVLAAVLLLTGGRDDADGGGGGFPEPPGRPE